MNALRQMLFFKLTPDSVVARVGHVREPIMHAERKEDSGVCPDGDGWITLLYLV